MRLVKPSYKILFISPKPLEMIEAAGRTCYKTEKKITARSAKKFVRMIIKRGHFSVIEHPIMTVRIICDRGITHEIVRHRLASYSQECVSGNTEVRKGLTIKDLYDRKHGTCYDRTHNKTIRLRSVNDDGNIIPNAFVDVFYKGIAEVFEIKTKLGYAIRCTKEHKFLTSNGKYRKLKLLYPGDSIRVNGRPCLLQIEDNSLTDLYLNKGMTPLAISNQFDVPYGTVLSRLQKLGIFSSHLNDSNKKKYTANHTQNSYAKMKATIQQQYDDGRIVWNKGIKEGEHPSVDKQAESLRKHHHNNQSGEKNSNWNGGPTGHAQAQILKKDIKCCELCGKTNRKLEVHHKNGDSTDNEMTNIIKICIPCHTLLHKGWYIGKEIIPDKITSIKYIGKEEVYDLEMANPYHNYIANGFVTHNSTRYCNYKGGVTYIIPHWLDLEEGNWDDVGNVILPLGPMSYNEAVEKYGNDKLGTQTWLQSMIKAEKDYQKLLSIGWSPGQARSVLPTGLKTEIVMTANFREWMQVVFKLRTGKPAHSQMREIMIPLLKEMQKRVPVVFDEVMID